MEAIVTRFVTDLIGRLTGPLTLRLFLQPGIATFLGIRDGLHDARDGRPPHFWRMVTGPPEARKRRLKETWRAVLKVFSMAVLLDCVYQFLVLRWIYPFGGNVHGGLPRHRAVCARARCNQSDRPPLGAAATRRRSLRSARTPLQDELQSF